MDPSVIGALGIVVAALLTGAFALFGQRSKYPAEYMDDVREDLERVKRERDHALQAAARALSTKGEVEAYARHLEEQCGVPHRRWTDHPMNPEGAP